MHCNKKQERFKPYGNTVKPVFMAKMNNQDWKLYEEWCNDEQTTLEFDEWCAARETTTVGHMFNLLKQYNQLVRGGNIQEAERVEWNINRYFENRNLTGFQKDIFDKIGMYILSDKQLWCVAFAMQAINPSKIEK